jgi:circadian clock protein KaiC
MITGSPGTGKTVTALEVLARAASRGDRGVFVGFEERPGQLIENARGFSWGKHLDSDAIRFVSGQVLDALESDSAFDLHGLLAALQAIDARSGLDWVVLDGVDVVLDWLGDTNATRRELVRLRDWISDSDLHGILTAKRNGGGATDSTLSYVADVVISMHHDLSGRSALRDVRVEKMRGSTHSANLHPLAITSDGVSIGTGAGTAIEHRVFSERVSAGVDGLDEMLGGGYYRGSAVLISGAPGTAKTSLAAAFVQAACERDENALFVSFDEAANQIVRNMSSISLDLGPLVDDGRLVIESLRSRSVSPESHVVRVRRAIEEHDVSCLVVDPVSAFEHAADPGTTERTAIGITDFAKQHGVTVLLTTLLGNTEISELQHTPTGISTVADTWLQLRYVDQGGERNRSLSIVKSRGMGHSRQVRELLLSDEGIDLAEVYTAGGEVLMGTLRWEKERERRQSLEDAIVERESRIEAERAAADEAEARLKALQTQRTHHRQELERLESEMDRFREERAAFEEEVRRRRKHRGT